MEEMTSKAARVTAPPAGIPVSAGVNMPHNVRMPKPAAKPASADAPETAAYRKPPAVPAFSHMPVEPDMYTHDNPSKQSCGYKTGELPSCAPLAAGYVPYQQKNPPKYAHTDALTHGTLFPGLDLPFMNVANKNNPYAGTPLGDLMAVDFAAHELSLYLDTHKDDKEAFEVYKSLVALCREGRREYTKLYGPIGHDDLEKADRYTWLTDPWPWEYTERTGHK